MYSMFMLMFNVDIQHRIIAGEQQLSHVSLPGAGPRIMTSPRRSAGSFANSSFEYFEYLLR